MMQGWARREVGSNYLHFKILIEFDLTLFSYIFSSLLTHILFFRDFRLVGPFNTGENRIQSSLLSTNLIFEMMSHAELKFALPALVHLLPSRHTSHIT